MSARQTGLPIECGAQIDRRKPRILFVASPAWLPATSTSGSPMIAHSLAQRFGSHGWSVGFVGLVKPERWPGIALLQDAISATGTGDLVRYWYAERRPSEREASGVSLAITEMDPDVVYCFGAEAAWYARRARPRGKIVVTFYDPPHLPALYKQWVEFRYGGFAVKMRALRKIPSMLRRWRTESSTIMPGLRASDVIISHSHSHGVRYGQWLGRRVEYFPNPLERVAAMEWQPTKGRPRFLLVGGLGSTPTLTGIYFLERHVLPALEKALARGDIQLRVIGGGRLPDALMRRLQRYRGIEFLGHVSQDTLLEEYSKALAILVPTPIRLGFRTRIVDAFRHGVPTIVHSANQAGFKELEHGRNCWMTEDGKEFAELILNATKDRAALEGIAARARTEFIERYSSDVFYNLVMKLATVTPGVDS